MSEKPRYQKYVVICTSYRPIVRDDVVVKAKDIQSAVALAKKKLAKRYKSTPDCFSVQSINPAAGN